jgi:hypothetical protein
MQCPSCHGSGEHWYRIYKTMPPDIPEHVKISCQECGGCGITYCCEGMNTYECELTVSGSSTKTKNV